MTRAPRARRASLAAALFILATASAHADDFIVYSPHVTAGRSEVEFRGTYTHDSSAAVDGTRTDEVSVGHAFTGWWKSEIYLAEYQRAPGQGSTFIGNEFENIFQLTPQGEYWVDTGFVLSYQHSVVAGAPSTLEFGPLFEKRSGAINHRLNLIWEKPVGALAGGQYSFRAAYSLTDRLSALKQPGIEAYLRPSDRSYQIGPVMAGELPTRLGNEFEYSLGLVFGVNARAPDQTLLARVSYEFF